MDFAALYPDTRSTSSASRASDREFAQVLHASAGVVLEAGSGPALSAERELNTLAIASALWITFVVILIRNRARILIQTPGRRTAQQKLNAQPAFAMLGPGTGAMKIRIIGGGPAGLFFAYLMGRADAGHDIRVYERDPESATYGWGLVFSDVALSFVRDIAPELYESMTRDQVVFDAMAIVHQRRARARWPATPSIAWPGSICCARSIVTAGHAGVGSNSSAAVTTSAELADCDLIVAADGANSAIRTRYGTGSSRRSTSGRICWRGTARRGSSNRCR